MPDRIIRAGIITSDRMSQLTWFAEVFYRRLMSVVDDFGRFDARPAILRSALFPLQIDRVGNDEVEDGLRECAAAGLVQLYRVDNKPYLELLDFRQRMRSQKSKWPAPGELTPDSADCGGQLPADDSHAPTSADIGGQMRPETETETETEAQSEAEADTPPCVLIVSHWNTQFCANVRLTPKRRRDIKARWKDSWWRGNWVSAIERAAASSFCRGGGRDGWEASIDWFLRPDSATKIMEGVYDGSTNTDAATRGRTRGNAAYDREAANAAAFAAITYAADPTGS